MTPNYVTRAAWLAVVTIVLLQTDSIIGFLSEGSSLAEIQSTRVPELIKISSRLVRRKRFVSTAQLASKAVDGAPPQDLPDVQQTLSRKRRDGDDTTPWADMEDKYAIFYDAMSQFIQQLLGNLKPGYPAPLVHMQLIPDIMPKNDPDFMNQNEDEVVERVFISLGFTARVLDGVKKYVKNDSLTWFDDEAELLKIWMYLVELTLANVRLSDTQTIDYYKAGIGDINIGLDTYTPVDVDALKELLNYI